MNLNDATRMIDGGVKFGDVFPFLDDPEGDGDKLRAHFCWGPGGRPAAAVSVRPAKPAGLMPKAVETARAMGYEGDPCGNCGALKMKRTGPCLTCDACGQSSGGCS